MSLLTTDPETGRTTTTYELWARRRQRQLAEAREKADRRLLDDALNWRSLPDRVKARLLKKHGGGK